MTQRFRASRYFLLLFCSLLRPAFAQFPNANTAWADSVMASLTLDEKIGQLMMPRANFTNVPYDAEKLRHWVQEFKIGGLVFFSNQPTRQALMVNELQGLSKTPLLVGMDLEWGLAMRLDSGFRFPYQMTLGALPDRLDLIEKMGYEIGLQCRRLGVQVSYAPVADVNNNASNPVINFRSFGENRERVFQKALAYMKGLQRAGIITSAKHFPGHGDTAVDSHADLPIIPHDRARLDSVELYPFKRLIQNGLNGVMVAHLSIPALDSTTNLASTLSRRIVTDLLRNELAFEGLIFTDAMEMQGVAKYYGPGLANVRAIQAGNDLLETFTDVPGTFNALKYAVQNGEISLAELDAHVRRILLAKAWAGLDRYRPIRLENLTAELNPASSVALNRQLLDGAVTVVRNADNRLPIRQLAGLKVATLALGTPAAGAVGPTVFQRTAANYLPAEHFSLTPGVSADSLALVREKLAAFDLVLVSIQGLGIRPAATIPESTAQLVNAFGGMPNAVYTLFGNPYTLARFGGLATAPQLLVTYQDTPQLQEEAAQVIFGGVGARGQLPVTVNETFRAGQGQRLDSLDRLRFGAPEEVGLDAKRLAARLDSIVEQGLTARAFPGASVLVAKKGRVIFQKTYGYQTYEAQRPVQPTDLYDLASMTKVSASVLALMRLQDEGKFRLDMTLGELFPKWRRSNKADLKMLDILTHQSGLKAWIPFWQACVDSTTGGWKPRTFRATRSAKYSVEVADNLFLHRRYRKVIFNQIRDSPVKPGQGYVYSDLSYYLYPQIIERITGQKWDSYLKKTFYEPLGATTLTYTPRKFYALDRIVPTEYDSLFRKTLIHGRVHDEGAAMLDGISGHAGLFGTATDLAKLYQMYLNGGSYGGQRFIQESTIKQWTSYPFSVEVNARRGVGFDKPDRRRPGLSAPPSASPLSFGHSGFTGTFVWVDPAEQLLYIFLSNRVYPTRANGKISQLNTRTQFGEMIYQAIRASGRKGGL